MKRTVLLIAIIFTAIAALNLFPKVERLFKTRPVQDAEMLRHEIAASIRNPFNMADTMVLDTRWFICGNSNPDELPVIFDTKLEDGKYRQLLMTQFNQPVLTKNEFYDIMDEIRKTHFYNEYPPGWWDTCRIRKVLVNIRSEQLSPKHVLVYENYDYADTIKSLIKDFTYNDRKWTYTITDTSTNVYPN